MSIFSPQNRFRHQPAIWLLVLAWLLLGVFFISALAAQAGESATREAFRRQLNLVYNHPNPFNPSTTISYVLLAPAHVQVHVYNLRGQQLACLVDEDQTEGENLAVWKTQTAPSGTYIFSLEADGVRVFRKMMLVR